MACYILLESAKVMVPKKSRYIRLSVCNTFKDAYSSSINNRMIIHTSRERARHRLHVNEAIFSNTLDRIFEGKKLVTYSLPFIIGGRMIIGIPGKSVCGRLDVSSGHLLGICGSSRMIALLLYHSIAPCTSKRGISASSVCHLWWSF